MCTLARCPFHPGTVARNALHPNLLIALWCFLHYTSDMEKLSKTLTIQIRLTKPEKAGLVEAAELAGVPLSSWVRQRLRSVAIRELEDVGRRAPFVAAVPLGGQHA